VNDTSTTIDDLKRMANRWSHARGWDALHNPKDLAIGLVTEASELMQLFRFRTLDEITKLLEDRTFQNSLADEIGDVLLMLTRLAEKCNCDLSSAMANKLAKYDDQAPNSKRKGI
jgi:NTP pyrophosphatase (non-canonical NTP hydrolase)